MKNLLANPNLQASWDCSSGLLYLYSVTTIAPARYKPNLWV